MILVLHPRVAPSKNIRVWFGAFEATAVPVPQWTVDGVSRAARPLRPIANVRPLSSKAPTTFSGIFEFDNLTPDTYHTVGVTVGSECTSLQIRTLPDKITANFGEWFNVMLVSCFHQAEDRQGLAGLVVSQLPPTQRPNVSLLMGDQVYLDLPTLQDFRDDVQWLSEKFEQDYIKNWRGPEGYARILDSAPSIAMPDDHEYWNNFPHVSPFIGNSYTDSGRKKWTHAARSLYEHFQLAAPATVGEACEIDIAPLSIYVADTRSKRDAGKMTLMKEGEPKRLAAWVDRVIERRMFGIIVTGQSLLSNPVEGLKGKVADYEMPNYADFPAIVHELHRLASAGRGVLAVTGDVHWGRIAEATNRSDATRQFFEIISSPASLVTTVGADQWADVKSFVSGLFGKKDPWPRHSDPDPVPNFFTDGKNAKVYSCLKYHNQRGNHVAILSFRQVGFGLDARVTYYPIHQDSNMCKPIEVNLPRLGQH